MAFSRNRNRQVLVIQNRYHGLDFARAVLLLLGVFYHAALLYRGDNSWRVVSSYSSEILYSLTNFTTDFRMEGFYLISGFFFIMLFVKNRPSFLTNRIFRILVPLLFVSLTVNNYLRMASYNYDYSDNIKYYILLGQWLEHLWFLGNLVLYFIVGKILAPFLLRFNQNSKKTLPLAMFFTPIFSALLEPISSFFHYDKVFFITIRQLFYYFPYFLLGFFCYHFKFFFFKIFNYYFAFFSLFIYFSIELIFYKYLDLFYITPYISSSFATFGIIAILNKIGSKRSNLIGSVSEAGYTIYLTHTAVIVFIYINFLRNFNFNVYISYFAMCSLVFFITFSFHFFVVQRFPLIRLLLNGVKFSPKNENLV